MTEKNGFHVLVEFPWIVFLVYWLVAAIKTRATRQEEAFASRYLVVSLQALGFVLVFSRATGIGFLGNRFMPRDFASAISGVALTWLGIGLAIWARYHLAEYWSARVTIKEDHQLIRTGPYAHLRHPIYSGVILATIGSALVIDEWRCVLGICVVLAAFCLKAKREETMLSQQFGSAFDAHKQSTGFLIPRLR
jgi:protein-S-isoprenylcysteine O-methyltransferase Ste14